MIAHSFPHLAQQLFNRPLALHPGKAEVLMAALAARLGVLDITRLTRDGQTVALQAPDLDGEWAKDPAKPYAVVEGVAIIEIAGTLVQKLGSLRPYSGMTGYDGMRACFMDAVADKAVRGICLSVDSPGGDVAGCFDLVDAIAAARGRKPVHAILNEVAYSAAYAIASATDKIWVPRTGGVGSIGVIALLVDMSKWLEREGVTVNLIQFGARKADGQPFIPLPPEARARFQADVDAIGALFVETVAANRGIAADTVRATEAATFTGPKGVADAVRLGLADEIAAPDAAFRELLTLV